MQKLLTLTATDKPVLASALSAVGIKARIRVLNRGLRLCFEGEQSVVLFVLNGLGFVNGSGNVFTAFSFNQPHEIFVTYKGA